LYHFHFHNEVRRGAQAPSKKEDETREAQKLTGVDGRNCKPTTKLYPETRKVATVEKSKYGT
jgi:hypothetical protein